MQDLQLLKDLEAYKEIDAAVASVTYKVFWYLNAELVPLELFSSNIDIGMKQEIMEKLLLFPKSKPKKVPYFTEQDSCL